MNKPFPVVLAVLGIVNLMNVARNQRFEAFHTVDVVALLASGMCFGVALALTLHRLKVGKFK